MLGMKLVTHQTGPEGREVQRVLVEEGLQIDARALSRHRARSRQRPPVVMAVAAGGMEIEEVAEETPELIFKEYDRPGRRASAVPGAQARVRARAHGRRRSSKAVKFMLSLYDAFIETDASLVEINPLSSPKTGDVLALDAKMNFDDNALFRHKEIMELRDLNEEEPLEVEASKFDLNYIKLDGNIGCMVNGAGLAMATMDIIKLAGGEPANFLDVGGGANAEQVKNAFKHPACRTQNVKAVLINIFGGIVRCDMLAQGVIAAVKELGVRVPIVVRLEGTNVEQGKQMLSDSGLNFTTADAWARRTMSREPQRRSVRRWRGVEPSDKKSAWPI